MTVRSFTGHFTMFTKTRRYAVRLVLGVLPVVGVCHVAEAADAPSPRSALHRVEQPSAARDWYLDTAVFTEISAVTASEVAVRLPDDQREEVPTTERPRRALAEVESPHPCSATETNSCKKGRGTGKTFK